MPNLSAIGNACIDIVADVPENFLRERGFHKSICSYLSLEQADALEASLPSPLYIPGGCGANTASIVAALGGRASFMGKLSDDAIGRRFLNDLKERGIHFAGKAEFAPGKGSTRVFTFITPDRERTFAAYYGIQEDLSPSDIDAPAIRASRILYLDGYALNAAKGAEMFLKAAKIAREAGNRVAFSPSDISILENYPDAVRVLTPVTDIILCNEREALKFSGEIDLSKAIQYLSEAFPSGAVTVGEQGAWVFDSGQLELIPAAPLSTPIADMNGAGDAFSGGFLYGLSEGFSLEASAVLGNRCAAAIIGHTGARPNTSYKAFLDDLP
jgi:sugar/nucleoside kinase (ribokinase family)